MAIEISPSAEARQVFNMMVVRAERVMADTTRTNEELDETLILTLARTIELSATLQRSGEDAQARAVVAELRAAEWIEPDPDGGWRLS